MKTQTYAILREIPGGSMKRKRIVRPTSLATLVSTALAAVLLAAAPVALSAQSVSFAGTQKELASFSAADSVSPVAVDGKGDAFFAVANGASNTLYEAPVNGSLIILSSSFPFLPSAIAVDAPGANLYFLDPVSTVDCLGAMLATAPVSVGTTPSFMPCGFTIPSDPIPIFYSSLTGLAVDPSGNLYIADNGAGMLYEMNAPVMSSSLPTNALILASGAPWDIAVNGNGTVYFTVSSGGVNQLAEVPASSFSFGVSIFFNPASATLVAGNIPSIQSGLAIDPKGDIFVGGGSSPVAKVSGGSLVPVDSDFVNGTSGVATDSAGDLYIAGIDGTGTPQVAELQLQAVNFGSQPVASAGSALTLNYNVNASGTLGAPKVLTGGASNLEFTLASGNTCTGALTAGTTCKVNVAFGPKFAGLRPGAVQMVDGSGNLLATTMIYGVGTGPQIAFGSGTQTTIGSGLNGPEEVAVDAEGDVFVSDTFNARVQEIPTGGGLQITVGDNGSFQPAGVAVDGAGDVFVVDEGNGQVVEFPANGGAQIVVANGLSAPGGLALDGAGDVFIADEGNGRLLEVHTGGGPQTTVGSGLSDPAGVAVDGAGDVFIADISLTSVVEVPTGCANSSCQIAVGSGLSYPSGVAVDAAGDVFIADTQNNRVVEVPTGGGAQIAVGSGLSVPFAVAVDGAGDVFIADSGNNRVVELPRSQPPALTFAAASVNSTSSDSPQSVTIANIGNQSLSALTPGLSIGLSFEQVFGAEALADCATGFSLTPGASCNLSLSFTPTAAGSIHSGAVLTDNSLNGNPATQTIQLSGTGIALSQTITFNTIPTQVAGNSVTLTASASSELTVGFASETTSVCAVSGKTVKLITAGTCTIQATQAGNNVYAAAMPVSQSFTVSPAASFTITPIPAEETISRGVLGVFILELQSVKGFDGNVTLSCSGGPAGDVCVDFPQTVKVNGVALALSGILFPGKTTPGTYTITFTGVSGSLTNTATAKFTVK